MWNTSRSGVNNRMTQKYCSSCLEIRQSTIWYVCSLGQWDKRFVNQASDVPSIIFFRLFIDLGRSKLFTFIFVFFFFLNKQIDWKYFCKEFCKKSWKKIILGTSDAWSTIHLSHRPSDRAWIYLRLTNFRLKPIWSMTIVVDFPEWCFSLPCFPEIFQ